MQHLRRAQAIENVDAEVFEPAPSDVGRQRFAGRGAAAQVEFFAFGQFGAGQQRAVERRHAVENRRPVFLQNAANRLRRRPLA